MNLPPVSGSDKLGDVSAPKPFSGEVGTYFKPSVVAPTPGALPPAHAQKINTFTVVEKAIGLPDVSSLKDNRAEFAKVFSSVWESVKSFINPA